MARAFMALTVAVAGVVVAATHHDPKRPAQTRTTTAASGPVMPLRVRASRGEARKLLPARSTPHSRVKARHHAATVVVPHDLPGRQQLLDVTAYCATGNRTASGAWPQIGMAATLDRSIPVGTTLHIAGYGDVTVTDRIGWGSDVDLYLGAGPACERAASRWGRRRLLVTEVAS